MWSFPEIENQDRSSISACIRHVILLMNYSTVMVTVDIAPDKRGVM